MPMRATFECDQCGKVITLSGNIQKAVFTVEDRGWLAGRKVECPTCYKRSSVVEVFTDGSCVGSNPGWGGWAWATDNEQASGSEMFPTTNQRMEIKAAVEALKYHNNPMKLVSDSRYVVNCLEQRWYIKWEKNGWVTDAGEPVKNRDLWEELIEVRKSHPNLLVEWVKGHRDSTLNNLADELAKRAARECKILGTVKTV